MVENRGPPELVRPAPGPAPPGGIQVLPLEVLASEHIPGRPHKPAQKEVLLQIADGWPFLAILVEQKSSGRYGGRLLLPALDHAIGMPEAILKPRRRSGKKGKKRKRAACSRPL